MTPSRTRSAMLPCRTTGRRARRRRGRRPGRQRCRRLVPGRSEYGPQALGHRSLLVDPSRVDNLQRMNAIKVARSSGLWRRSSSASAPEIFEGVVPSPYMLFVHRVRPEWRERIAAAVHIDGTAAQTVDRRRAAAGAVAGGVRAAHRHPVLINTSFNTAGRPMVDSPRDALECFGSGPIGALVLGPFVVHRNRLGRA